MSADSNEIPNVAPTVRIGSLDNIGAGPFVNYQDVTDLRAVKITDEFAIRQSTALLEYQSGADITGPITLDTSSPYKHDMRVIIYNYGDDDTPANIWFQGWLKKKGDQHAPGVVLWTAIDDRKMLLDAPVRGAFVRDTDDVLRYAASIPTSFNPGGRWNCTGMDIGGTIYPVLSPSALMGANYESPDEAYPSEAPTAANPFGLPVDGSIVPWTPRRALEYLRLHLYFEEIIGPASGIEGMRGDVEGSIKSAFLEWTAGTNAGLSGVDPGVIPATTIDPLDRKLQPMLIQGDTGLGALSRLIGVAGTHDIDILYDTTGFTPETPPAGKSRIFFKPIGYTAQGLGLELGVQFAGLAKATADEGATKTDVYDFSLDEDSTETVPFMLCEGDTSRVETRMEYLTLSPLTSTIVPAWDILEEDGFLRCIYGNADLLGDPGKWALVPIINGDTSTDPTDFLEANGATANTPFAHALSAEALALARQSYPNVYRAWRINPIGDVADALQQPDGANGYLRAARPLLPKQLQFYTWLSEEAGDDRLRTNLPIRVSVELDQTRYIDIPRDTPIRVTADDEGSLIWLEGLAETIDGTDECLYRGSLGEAADIQGGAGVNNITLKNLRINAAMPTDYRTTGFAHEVLDWRDGALSFAFNGVGPSGYLDSPGSFKENLQYKSYPAANPGYFGGVDGTVNTGNYADGLTRELPPGSEQTSAFYAAKREFAKRKNIKRTSSWKRHGIHNFPEAGDWISRVNVYKHGTLAYEYPLESSIGTVEWDFIAQVTTVGNVFGEI